MPRVRFGSHSEVGIGHSLGPLLPLEADYRSALGRGQLRAQEQPLALATPTSEPRRKSGPKNKVVR